MRRFLKITAVILLFLFVCSNENILLCSFATETAATEAQPIQGIVGDVNSDGAVSAEDARLLLRASVRLEQISEIMLAFGDFDADKQITSADARVALRLAVGLESAKCLTSGHVISEKKYTADCVNKGYSVKVCANCSYVSEPYDEIPVSGHNFAAVTEKATCVADGVTYKKCTVCGEITEKTVTEKAKGHSFGFWTVHDKGKNRTCKICNFTENNPYSKTVYLTFDDGPGPYTKKLLGYLKEYNVKATFFVTNQNSKYKHLYKEIVNDGHAIGVHSYTHNWSIYSNKDSYLKDFNAMHKLILDETGVDTKIFRFPGGTNNTVSRKYSKGIMSQLSKMMREKGYVYYDWNVDCYDTQGYNSSQIAQTTINQIKKKQTSIVLMHDIKNSTVESIKTIIQYGLKNGYEFAAIDESTPIVAFKPAN